MSRRAGFKPFMSVAVASVSIAGLVALGVVPITGQAQQEAGKQAFERYCASCHGNSGEGGSGPALVPLPHDNARVLTIVRNGGAQMAAISAARISDADVTAVAEYLRALGVSRGVNLPAGARMPPTGASKPGSGVATTTLAPVEKLTPVTDAMLANPDPSAWLSWRRTLDAHGHSPLNQINAQNVKGLKLEWSWGMDPGASQTTPLVHDGIVYVASPGNVVHALDGRTGQLRWEYRRQTDDPTAQMRNLAIYGDLIYLNTGDAHIIGLDARTGAVRWDTEISGKGKKFRFTSGPIVADGVVIAGLTGCGSFEDDTCYIVAVDGRTGKELWRTSTIARPGEPGGDTWSGLEVMYRAGGDAWIPGSYDPVTKVVYWGTAQAKPWHASARGTDGEALYTNSTLAMDPKSGKVQWYFQHIPRESHDMDETFERILVDFDGKRSVFSMGKLGILWELDRATGRFVRATDLGYQTLVDVDPKSGKAIYRPGMLQELGKEFFMCPTTGGFKSLRAMSYFPTTGSMVVPVNLYCQTAIFKPMERRPGGGGVGPVEVLKYHFHPKAPGQMGEVVSVDIRSGKQVWRQRRRAPYNTSALTTAGGLVFIGSWDRYAFAYDVRTGAELWQTRLPTMANGSPITYAIDGKQYVAFVAGGAIASSTWATRAPVVLLPDVRNPPTGNSLLVFALP
jgi:alcohol dehydrogenase (cytochrome c)